jgi:hypothetical protein
MAQAPKEIGMKKSLIVFTVLAAACAAAGFFLTRKVEELLGDILA